jgi:hypothetical protein
MKRRCVARFAAAAALAILAATPALGAVSPTQPLPTAACNQGTMNAHENIPEMTGSGKTTPAHGAVPGGENESPSGCGHGG